MTTPVTPFAEAYPAPWRIQGSEVVDCDGCHVNSFDDNDPAELEYHRGIVEAVNTQAARALAAEAALEQMREVLDEALVTLKHARVFIGGREKMHPDGQALFDECINKIDATLQGGGE